MMKRIIRLSTITFVLVLFIFGFSACGKKTKPVPPQSLLPEPVSDLTYELDNRGVLLTWTFSGHPESDNKSTQLPDFEVLKSEIAAEDFCPDCPVQYSSSILLSGSNLKTDSSGKITYRDGNLKTGYYYHYKVRPMFGRSSSALESNAVSFLWQAPE